MEARSLAFAFLSLSVLALDAAHAGEKVLDRTFQVQPGGRLNVELQGGHIVVIGSDKPQVVVHLKATGSEDELDELTWSAEKDEAGVIVKSKRDSGSNWFNWGGGVKLKATIEVPRQYNVELQTSGGNIELKALNGNANGRTSGGRLNIDSVRGDVEMRTSGGSIAVNSVQGAVQVHTSGGAIQASRIDGRLSAHTSGGSIQVSDAGGPVDVHTSGGSINIDLAAENEGVLARTSGGSIHLNVASTIRASINASTSGGRVSSDLPLTTTEVGKSSLRGTMNGGGPEIKVRSSGGSVYLKRRD
jgi:hypothetical protein